MANTTGSQSYARSVTGVGTTSGAAGLTGSANSFFASDVGAPITGAGINAGTTILSVTSGTVATMSANATATATVTVSIGPRLASAAGYTGWRPEADTRNADYSVASNNAGVVPLDRLADNITRTNQYVEH